MTDAQWARIADQMMDRLGLAPEGDPNGVRWIAVRHADDHIHVAATLARTDGIRPNIWQNGYLIRDACRAAEDELGLRRTAPADWTAVRRPTRGEMQKTRHLGLAGGSRSTLRRHVQDAAATARTEAEFFERLREAGVLVRHRYSQDHPDQATRLRGRAAELSEGHRTSGLVRRRQTRRRPDLAQTPIALVHGRSTGIRTRPGRTNRPRLPPDHRSSSRGQGPDHRRLPRPPGRRRGHRPDQAPRPRPRCDHRVYRHPPRPP
ncbi:hypothetical protein [Actinomadura oligospora]|uniref:hypothetical protein n=1 Tax=Actinomadura oligospora TaxID=111804 RepID=UPI003CCC27E1